MKCTATRKEWRGEQRELYDGEKVFKDTEVECGGEMNKIDKVMTDRIAGNFYKSLYQCQVCKTILLA